MYQCKYVRMRVHYIGMSSDRARFALKIAQGIPYIFLYNTFISIFFCNRLQLEDIF